VLVQISAFVSVSVCADSKFFFKLLNMWCERMFYIQNFYSVATVAVKPQSRYISWSCHIVILYCTNKILWHKLHIFWRLIMSNFSICVSTLLMVRISVLPHKFACLCCGIIDGRKLKWREEEQWFLIRCF
jgi:hypothetical protein